MMSDVVLDCSLVDRILDEHRAMLGGDFDGYRNHIYRVASFFNALGPHRFEDILAVRIAAAFHDMGVWSERTFDYLEPSSELARTYLEQSGRQDIDAELVHELIVQHHKLRPYLAGASWASIVEQWRKADVMDVTLGLVRFGVPARNIRRIQRALPDRGFHARLLTLTLHEFCCTPWRPLPMMKW